MERTARFINALCLLYAAAIVGWQALRLLVGDRWWWLIVANTFALYLFLPLALLIPLALASRRRAALAAVAAPTIFFALLYGGLFLPQFPPVKAGEEPTLRVMTLNLLYINDDGAAVEQLIEAKAPDLICFQELTPFLAADLQARLDDSHPYRLLFPAEGTTGIGIFSRYPLTDGGLLPDPAEAVGWWRRGALAATVNFQGQPLALLDIHAIPPSADILDPRWPRFFEKETRLREQELAAWLEWAARQESPLIAAGDFNLTDQHAAYRLLTAHLNDAYRRAGWGLGHTWPAYADRYMGLPLFTRILRLDYVWYSDHWQPVEAHVAPWDGQSDHRAVVATLVLRRKDDR